MPQGDTDSTCSRTADEDVAAASQMEQDQDMSGPTTDITRIQDIQQCSASTSHVTSNIPPEGQENEDCTATCRQQIASLECTIKQLQSEKNEVEMNLFEQLTVVHEENQRLQEKLRLTKYCVEVIQNNDTKTCFYTGLPCFDLFKTLFEMLKGYTQTQPDSKGLDQFFAVLVKLRLNVPIQFLADRLDCSKAQFSGFFHMWLDAMYHNLKQLIVWPEAQTLQENLPTSFKKHYSKVRCIIDCFEVFIEKPLSLDTRAATFSNYKKHNTLKVLIAISPTGSIVFISKAWGGRVSDKVITQESEAVTRPTLWSCHSVESPWFLVCRSKKSASCLENLMSLSLHLAICNNSSFPQDLCFSLYREDISGGKQGSSSPEDCSLRV